MSFKYSGDPNANDRDKVRFLIGDTDADSPLLQDKEIAYLLVDGGTPNRAAVQGCLALAAKFARLMDESVGDVSKSYSQRSEAFFKLADKLRLLNSEKSVGIFAGGISDADKQKIEQDPDSVKPAFTRDLHDNLDIKPDLDPDNC